MMPNNSGIFSPEGMTKVEALRKTMLLTTGNMADLLGVSRTAYFNWRSGRSSIRVRKEAEAKDIIKRLLNELKAGWPEPEIRGMTNEERYKAICKRIEKPPAE